MNKCNKGFRFLLYVIDIHSKYGWVVPLKDEKNIIITNDFQNILDDSNRKQRKYGWIKKVIFKTDQ